MSRQTFIDAAASEKITLVKVYATKRYINYTLDSGSIYTKTVNNFVTALKDDAGNTFTQASSTSLSAGEFYYEVQTSTLYLRMHDNSDPNDAVLISTVALFFGTHPMSLPHDLISTSYDVYWDGRVDKAPNFKTQIGIDQDLVSTIGNGTLQLANTDGALDEIYDDLVFENQNVEVYSINRKLGLDSLRKIFIGVVHDKTYDSESVSFTVKDQFFTLLDNVPQGVYSEADGVNDSIYGRAKRWVYGRVDGLKTQSIDQIGEGYTLTGTVSSVPPRVERTEVSLGTSDPSQYQGDYFRVRDAGNENTYDFYFTFNGAGSAPSAGNIETEIALVSGDGYSEMKTKINAALLTKDFVVLDTRGNRVRFETEEIGEVDAPENGGAPITLTVLQEGGDPTILNGTGTSFLSDVSPSDNITIGRQSFKILTVRSDTQLVLDDEVEFHFTDQPATLLPEIPTTVKNRDHFVCEHATAQLTKTVTSALQFNRIQLSDTDGILAGDIVEFVETGERIEVKNVAPNNIIVLQQNVITKPSVGTNVIRQPIQDIYIEGVRVRSQDYSITNTSGLTSITLTSDAEFNITTPENLIQTLTFTNGSRTITGGEQLTEILSPRDWIKPNDITYADYYEILEVQDNEITLRVPFDDPTITDTAEMRRPNYVGDDTIVSVNVLGKTSDGTPTGDWLKTSADVTRDLIREIGLTDRINESSFTVAKGKAPQLVSLMIPTDPTATSPTVKDTVDLISRSTNCALSLDNDLNLAYNSTLIRVPTTPRKIDDSDCVRWSIKSKSGKLYKFSTIRYRHSDINRFTLEKGNELSTKTSRFVTNYVGTAKTIDRDIYLYDSFDANIFAERILYYNSLAIAEIVIETDLRLEGLEIGDVVQLEFERLYKHKGGDSRKKLAAVTGKTLTGDRMTITLTDYGNTFNTSSFITANDAPDYSLSDDDEKLKHGFITDGQGIVNDVEATAEINKIS